MGERDHMWEGERLCVHLRSNEQGFLIQKANTIEEKMLGVM